MRAGLVGARRVHSETMVIWPGFRLRDAAAIFAACCFAAMFAYATPARAQSSAQSQAGAQIEVSLDYFHERLAPFGKWLNHPVWGEVWQPDAGPNFRPYFYGYWDYTSDYGSLWVSNEPYGDIVYHYGRWLFDMNYGWLWVPGYVWGPSWVVWRANQDYVGWLPMPPGYLDYDQPLRTAPYAGDDWYGYQTFYGPTFVSEYFYTLWVFVQNNDFGRSDRRRYVVDIRRLRDLYQSAPRRRSKAGAEFLASQRADEFRVARQRNFPPASRCQSEQHGPDRAGRCAVHRADVPGCGRSQHAKRHHRKRSEVAAKQFWPGKSSAGSRFPGPVEICAATRSRSVRQRNRAPEYARQRSRSCARKQRRKCRHCEPSSRPCAVQSRFARRPIGWRERRRCRAPRFGARECSVYGGCTSRPSCNFQSGRRGCKSAACDRKCRRSGPNRARGENRAARSGSGPCAGA